MKSGSKLLLAYLIYCFAWIAHPYVRMTSFINPEITWLLILIGLNGYLIIATYISNIEDKFKISIWLLVFVRTSFCLMVIIALAQWEAAIGIDKQALKAEAVKWYSYYYNFDVSAALGGKMIKNEHISFFSGVVYIEILLAFVAYVRRLLSYLPADWSVLTTVNILFKATIHTGIKRIREAKKALVWKTTKLS